MATTKLSDSGTLGNKYENLSADNNYMETIASTLVGSGGASTVAFSNIPQGYKHLQLRMSNALAVAVTLYFIGVTPNSDAGANYGYHRLYGNGTSAASNGGGSTDYGFMIYGGASKNVSTATYPSVGILDILDYSNTNKYKTGRSLYGQDANGSGEVGLASGLWMNTAAITSLTVYGYGNSLAQNTRLSLYGIKG